MRECAVLRTIVRSYVFFRGRSACGFNIKPISTQPRPIKSLLYTFCETPTPDTCRLLTPKLFFVSVLHLYCIFYRCKYCYPIMRQAAVLLAIAVVAIAQDNGAYAQQDYGEYGDNYQDYAEQDDSLYASYAAKQQEKAAGGGGGPGVGKMIMACGLGWIAGAKIHSGRATKKMGLKQKSEQKKLYTQYYNDVYKLQEANAELETYIQQLSDGINGVTEEQELERIQRDYDEFKQPDIDGDDRISRAEFNMYIRDYLQNYPGLDPKDYPKFEDFDHDGDGYIGFQEYAQQMALAVQKAEKQQAVSF